MFTFSSTIGEIEWRLFAYEWPGNIRELRNAVETMVVLDTDGVFDTDDLPPELADVPPTLSTESGNQPWELIGKSLMDIEKWAIQETLRMTSGNREEAARTLEIGARTLYRKIKEYGLQEKK